MNTVLNNLIEAENKAKILFSEIEKRKLVVAGKSEKELNEEVYNLAFELFGIKKFWHKRIVRAGKNTLCPYRENPPDFKLRAEEIMFFDFGPVFDEWEADLGRTFVIGNNPKMLKMQSDIEMAWKEGQEYYNANKNSLSGSDFYHFTKEMAAKYGWEFGYIHCGHLIGQFPHEKILGEEIINYIHQDNHTLMSNPDILGNERNWIYEIHFIDRELEIGGFYEQLL